MLKIILVILISSITVYSADVIPETHRMPWKVGVNVGVIGDVVERTGNIIDVTAAPYNCPTNGNDASVAINDAISDAVSNDVIYLPSGHYILSNSVVINKNYISLRGDGRSNTIIFPKNVLVKVGADAANYALVRTDWVTNGATKGSTTLILTNTPTFAVGDLIIIGSKFPSDETFQVYMLGNPQNRPMFHTLVTGISGNTVTIAAPMPFDYTNETFIINLNPVTYKGIGIEDLTITGTNVLNGETTTYGFLVQYSMAANCWLEDSDITYAYNYGIVLSDAAFITIRKNRVRFSQGAGSNHAGILTAASHVLIENNIIAEALQPGIEFNGGAAVAVFGNFFTNNILDIDMHSTHPIMYLWEHNIVGTYPVVTAGPVTNHYGGALELDGYFGSSSHQVIFRNNFAGRGGALLFKRWGSYISTVGNVLGNPDGTYVAFTHDTNGVAGSIIEFDRPNIGNNGYTGTNPPIPWNFPGHTISVFPNPATTNGLWVLTNTHINTNVLLGDFSYMPAYPGWIIFQDAVNTNIYYPADGFPILISSSTSSNITLARSITASNGWRCFYVSQGNEHGFQQLLTTNRHIRYLTTGNYDYYNDAQTWDSNGVQTLPVSYLYTNGAPNYWFTNGVAAEWPAVRPDEVENLAVIPAQFWYITGIEGTNSGGGSTLSITNIDFQGKVEINGKVTIQ